MNDHRQRVEHLHDVERNVLQFHEDLENNPKLVAKLTQFKHWYYLPEYDRFGASKYIGYRDMNFETYVRNFAKKMDGGRSEKALLRWFQLLLPDSTAWDFLHDKLKDFVESHGKKLNRAAAIHIPNGCSEMEIIGGWSEGMTPEAIQHYVGRFSSEEIGRRAQAVSRFNQRDHIATSKTTTVSKHRRDPFITENAKIQANGVCQLCEQPAPFYDPKGKPYLETHHILWLSKGGLDTVDNTVALCANCHRKMHILDIKGDREKLRQKVSEYQYISR